MEASATLPVTAGAEIPPEPVPDAQEEDAWTKKCVLTLDGGGIRGYASLCMLESLMNEIKRIEKSYDEPHSSSFYPAGEDMRRRTASRQNSDISVSSPSHGCSSTNVSSRPAAENSPPSEQSPLRKPPSYLPCHYFDYIMGTSTGGLNAIMLGRLRMGIDECLERYPGLADSVFGEGKKRSVMRRIVKLTSTKYDSTQLEKAINAIIQTRIPEREPRQKNFGFEQFHSPSDLCKTAVVAKEDNDVSSQTYVFRTYDLYCDPVEYHNPGPAHIDEIWKVGRATSAAPTFFKPIEIGGKKYSDGGVGHNNPVMIMLDEVTQGKRVNDTFHVVLSIGTGQKPTTIEKVQHKFPRLSEFKPVKKLVNILKALTDEAVNVENNHRSFQRITKEVGFEHYYRWRGGENVGGLKMDEWVTRPKRGKQTTEGFIRENVDAFMDQDDVKAQLDQLANKLVETRRARILNREKIRRFTWCTLYRCPVCVDADDGEWQETLDTLEAHILEVHTDIPPQDVEGLIRHLPPRLPPLCAPF